MHCTRQCGLLFFLCKRKHDMHSYFVLKLRACDGPQPVRLLPTLLRKAAASIHRGELIITGAAAERAFCQPGLQGRLLTNLPQALLVPARVARAGPSPAARAMYDFCLTLPYAALLALGGLMGFLTKGSLPSLLGGLGSAAVLAACGQASLSRYHQARQRTTPLSKFCRLCGEQQVSGLLLCFWGSQATAK